MISLVGGGHRGVVEEGQWEAGLGRCRGVPRGQRWPGLCSCAGEAGDGHVPEGHPSCGLPPHPYHAAQVDLATLLILVRRFPVSLCISSISGVLLSPPANRRCGQNCAPIVRWCDDTRL